MQSNDSKPRTTDTNHLKMVNFRQPLVTASGIFLGFMLNLAASWVGDAFTKYFIKDTILAISITLSIAFLMAVLYRILNMNYPTDNIKSYYQNTLRLFLAGISLPFLSFILVIVYRVFIKNS